MLPRATLLFALAWGCRQPAPQATPPPLQSCLDAQLAAKGLNEYGDPAGTAYSGGTPLFDERTGQRLGREEYLLRRHPEIASACERRD